MSAIDKISSLIYKYDFPSAVLNDINHRLECCRDESYVEQQLRYLENQIKFGNVHLKKEESK
ncbi:hypothetical protein IGI57_002573 [Enterococcus sp. DIV0213j]|jgi:hypothetical protein|uniref:DUF6877 family protein n=1 Tax=Enterococcus sp. DIV0213j TaxID=2774649 RepID=UPI003D2731FE